jgi:hypothetical protein
MGTGFLCLDRSKCGSECIRREEEGTNLGRVEIRAHTSILRHTPDHDDLVTHQTVKFSIDWWYNSGKMGGSRGEDLRRQHGSY